MEQALDQPELDRSLRTHGSRGQSIPSRKVVAISLVHVSVDGGRIHCGRDRRWAERSVTGNHRPDLFEDFLGLAVFQRRAEEDREGRQDFPVGAAIPHRIDRGPNDLDMALGIGEGPGFLHSGGGRKHHMGERSRFREKQFLADQEIEFAQCLFDSGLGRKAPDRIFSDDEQALDDRRLAPGRSSR